MLYCSKCGSRISDNPNYCPSCGHCLRIDAQKYHQSETPFPTIIYVQSPRPQQVYVHKIEKSKGVALLLCFFLGGLGIHQFYLGNTIEGVAYLLFSWTCIPTLISIVDFILLLCMSESFFHQMYNRER